MYFVSHKFARDERHFAVSAIGLLSAELVEVASGVPGIRRELTGDLRATGAIAIDLDRANSGGEVMAAAIIRGCEIGKFWANQSIQGTPGKRRFLRRSLVSGVPDL
jgi:hypothetical protein